MFARNCASCLTVVVFVVIFAFGEMEEVTEDPSMLYTSPDSINLTIVKSNCWDNSSDCNVAADLTRDHLNFTFMVIINCKEKTSTAAINRYKISERYTNVSKVALDGCNVNRKDTLGVEFVPDPSAVRTLSIRMFHILGDIPNATFIRYDKLESLNLTDNIIDGVSNSSFMGLNSLKYLTISNCDLRRLDNGLFTHLNQLRYLFIREPALNISHLTKLPDLVRLVIEVKTLDWNVSFPESLEELFIITTEVKISSETVYVLSHLSRLKTFHLVFTNISEWPTIQSNSLEVLNLSHNSFHKLNNHKLPTLHTYDVSWNNLEEITDQNIRSMPKLKFFLAHHNKLNSISPNAFVQNAHLQSVDLTGNKLHQFYPNLPAQQDVLVQVDDNEWSCRWADNFSTSNPQTFARFRYVKVLDSLNTRGLRCRFFEQSSLQQHLAKYPIGMNSVSTNTTILLRRNPKNTAMLTLIILVVGVAILFLMLFLHIKCRKEGLHFLPVDSMLHHQMADRTDFVRRKLPPTEYESPIVCLRNTPPLFDVEKRDTDEGFVYEEIAERNSGFSNNADVSNDDSTPLEEAIKTPCKIVHARSDPLQISSARDVQSE